MKTISTLFTVVLSTALFAAHGAAAADMAGMKMAPAKTVTAAHKGEGTVNKVDAANGKINLTHGPIKSLGWSGMTMDFPVKDKAMLAGIKPGQKVVFELEKAADGQYPITRITAAK